MTQTCALCDQPFATPGPPLPGNPKLYHWQCAYDSLATTREQLATFRQELSDRQAPATTGQPTRPPPPPTFPPGSPKSPDSPTVREGRGRNLHPSTGRQYAPSYVRKPPEVRRGCFRI